MLFCPEHMRNGNSLPTTPCVPCWKAYIWEDERRMHGYAVGDYVIHAMLDTNVYLVLRIGNEYTKVLRMAPPSTEPQEIINGAFLRMEFADARNVIDVWGRLADNSADQRRAIHDAMGELKRTWAPVLEKHKQELIKRGKAR